IFCAECADHVGQGGRRNHEADGLPGKQNEQCVKRKRHQRNANPEPSIAHGPAQKLENFFRSQALWLARGLHAIGHRNFATGAAGKEKRKQKECGGHATTFCWGTTTSVVRGFVWPTSSTPMQIRTTPTQRRGETLSCRKTTARNVSNA